MFGWRMQAVKRREQHTFKVLPQVLDCGEGLYLAELLTRAFQGL